MSLTGDTSTVECIVRLEHINDEQAVFRCTTQSRLPTDVGMLHRDVENIQDDIELSLGKMYEAKVNPDTEMVEQLLGPGV
ncbi:hypothetical protein [Salinibaculum rarum]|uniref:hypothetical protein n=1 Tax=Salinibaculum rarum TaxID=3058903 RepID=UPI00265D75A7|nr:hypothetical protein [Salinibaculum sp. KK48]